MKFKMARNSLFAILLRSPWWISLVLAAMIVLIARAAVPLKYFPFAATAAIPVLIISGIAAWRQMRLPRAAEISSTLESVSAMTWREFSSVMEAAFQREGFDVVRLNGPHADFAITKAGRTSVVSCKRWKAVAHGVEPLRELMDASRALEARESIYVALGNISDKATRYATERNIRVMKAADLAILLRP